MMWPVMQFGKKHGPQNYQVATWRPKLLHNRIYGETVGAEIAGSCGSACLRKGNKA